MSSIKTLTFNDTPLQTLSRNNVVYIKATDIALALGYASTKSVSNIFNKHSDEFTSDMFEVIETVTSEDSNLKRTELYFNRHGANLIGMFARTSKAKEFRQWVLSVLEEHAAPQPLALAVPQPEIPAPKKVSMQEIIEISQLYKQVEKMAEKIRFIFPDDYETQQGAKYVKEGLFMMFRVAAEENEPAMRAFRRA